MATVGAMPASAPPAGRPLTGLVSLSTSDTQPKELLIPNGPEQRCKRMRKGVFAYAGSNIEIMQQGGFRYRVAMITLTYRPGVDWLPLHITEALKAMRAFLKRSGYKFSYVWVMEMTKRGIPHYHLLVWLPRGVTLPLFDKQGWWKHGMSNAVWARRPVGYISKYVSKGFDNPLPRSARIWGAAGLDKAARALASWKKAPMWLKKFVPYGNKIQKQKEGWWKDCESGNRFRSPWLFDGWSPEGIKLRWVGWTYLDIELNNI
jgi:hypothetical protein